MPGPFDSLAQPSRATCERGEKAGVRRGLVRPARHLSCRLCRSRWDLAAGSSRVRRVCSWEPCWRREGCPGAMPRLRQALGALPEGAWVLTAPRPCRLGRRGAACLPRLRGLRGCSSSTRVETRRRWALCHIPIPGRCRRPPQLRGNGSRGWSMPNFTFQMGLLAPSQAALRVVKYFGKPRLGFSLKRLLLGKRRRAEQPAQSRHRGERRAAGRILHGRCWCWGAIASWLGCTGDCSWAG